LMRALRSKNVPVFALTNFGVESFEYAETIYPFFKEFDRRYVSGNLKMMKPDAAIYQAVEDDCGLTGDRLLFADDRPANIKAARARGWQGHLFETPQGLGDELVARGLLSKEEAAP